MAAQARLSDPAPASGRVPEVFGAFLRLGLTAFGGPVAHLGHFRDDFVHRRGWLDEAQFAQLLAVCQLLPGPASSQMGFAIGLLRAGWAGALAAFLAFTLPSALLLFAFARWAPRLDEGLGVAAVHGLKLVAVVVVGHALFGMARQLVPDGRRRAIALVAAVLVLATGSAWMQLLAIAAGTGLGLIACRPEPMSLPNTLPVRVGRGAALTALLAYAVLLAAALAWPVSVPVGNADLASVFYRAGALVFGGGHVVLPLLEQPLVATGGLDADRFLAGYGAAQAVPGPMFSLAAYLGAAVPGDGSPAAMAAFAVLSVFLPGFLLLLGVLPFWTGILRRPGAATALAGIHAAVVGVLAAAWIDPVCRQGLRDPVDVVVAAAGFLLVARIRRAAPWVVLWCVAASLVVTAAGWR